MNYLANSLAHANKLEEMLIESGGEITPEIEAQLSLGNKTPQEIVDRNYITIERLEMSEEYFAKKEEQFKLARLSLKKAQEFIKSSIKQYMIESGNLVLSSQDYTYKLSTGKPSVKITNEEEVYNSYKKEVTTWSVDKESIAEDLKKGIPVKGAVLEETYVLRKSINKGSKK